MLATTCLLMGLLSFSVCVYASRLASDWSSFTGNDIGGVTLGAAIGIVITASVLILGISIYGLYTNYHYSSYHIFVFNVLQLILVIFGVIATSVVYKQVNMLEIHIEENFDAGTHIRKNVGLCFCNIDEATTCSAIQCNTKDSITGLPSHYSCGTGPVGQCLVPTDARCMTTPDCTSRLASNWMANLASLGFLALYTLLFLISNLFTGMALRRRILREETGVMEEMEEMLPVQFEDNSDEKRTPKSQHRNHRRTPSGTFIPDLEAAAVVTTEMPVQRKAPTQISQPEIANTVNRAADLSLVEIEQLMEQLEAVRQAKLLQGCHAVQEAAQIADDAKVALNGRSNDQ